MLAANETEISTERSTRKEPLSEQEAEDLIARARTVVIAKGKRLLEKLADQAEIVDLKGPTGNFRAPIVLAGGTLLVGLSLETLERLVST